MKLGHTQVAGRARTAPPRAGGPLLALLVGLLAFASASPAAPRVEAQAATVVFGALLNSSPLGDVDTLAAVRLAVQDVNEYLTASGSPVRVEVQAEGTGLQPAEAVQKTIALADRGVKVIIGPESSGELAAISPLARQRDLVLISHCSTAPSLAIPDDGIFRLVPDDNRQAEALARMMWDDGIRTVVPIWRADVFGDDLSAATKRDFARLGGATLDGVRFDPDAESFSTELETLAARVAEAVAQHGPGAVGIHLLAFGPDSVPILRGAAGQPALAGVKWYGSDGTVQSREILADEGATRFALQTGFANSLFAETETTRSEQLKARIGEQIGGGEAHVCALAAYDAVWLASLSSLVTGTDRNAAALKQAIPRTAERYFGASGWTVLNRAGDREAADYDFWAIKDADGTPRWERVARYSGTDGKLAR